MKQIQIISVNEAEEFKETLVDYKFIVYEKILTDDAIDKSEIKSWTTKYVTDYNPDTNDYMKYEVKKPLPSDFNYFKTYVLDCIEDDIVEVQKFKYTIEDDREVFEMTLGDTVTWDMEQIRKFYKYCKVDIICSVGWSMMIDHGMPFIKSKEGDLWPCADIFDSELFDAWAHGWKEDWREWDKEWDEE